ncbi:PGF-CTERM sorting domain-containing protein [Natronorubrum sp. JWXQ-INN-674]|uniref:PGF-CTERM sorting domain-containing protein n=1 Tax=Natronorubrum halalkaliphilum TaxID=2691917 RepID=A0A6B0VRU2_9EURY|nr:CARDB domain-containing protein [Natronorubrum halalkaliphilum]MXV63787.1 PGF-CTERM sorting domain-containing protein [Natronorubrum halalkaliphilum]
MTSDYEDEEVRVIVGKVAPGATVDDLEMIASINDGDLQDLNDNIAFEKVTTENLDDNGELAGIEYDDADAGQYVALMATTEDGDGLTVDDENLNPEGPATIIGVEGFLVHQNTSEVTEPSSVDQGENATFTVDETGLSGDDVGHMIALYDGETFADSRLDVTVEEEFGEDFSKDDVQIESDIGGVEGVVSVDDGVDSDRFSGMLDFDTIIQHATNETPFSDEQFEAGDTILNASATAVVAGSDDVSIDVGTHENWTDGDYQWVHVATTGEADEYVTSEGTLTIGEDDTGVPGIPGPGPDPDPKDPPEFSVSNAELSDTKITTGDSVDVTATVTETADKSGTFTAELIIDGDVVDEQDVVLTPGGEETVSFTHTFDSEGDYEVAVNDATAGTVSVYDSLEPKFDVTSASLSEDEIEVGDDVDVTATVENSGGDSGTFTAELTVDGDVVAEEDVTVDSGDSETVTFTESFEETGEFEIAVSGTSAGTLTVDDDSGLLPVPGFGPAVAVLALLSVALLIARRQPN